MAPGSSRILNGASSNSGKINTVLLTAVVFVMGLLLIGDKMNWSSSIFNAAC
jgi:hypothetical protein